MGAAVSPSDYNKRISLLLQKKVDFVVVDTAHGDSKNVIQAVEDIKKKYDKNLEIYNYKNYVITVCKYDIMDILGKRLKLRKNNSKYESKWKAKMIDAWNRKNDNLLTTLNEFSYMEVRELFREVLDIREMAVIFLVHVGFNYCKIGETLKISADYCRKLYNQAEKKIRKALLGEGNNRNQWA